MTRYTLHQFNRNDEDELAAFYGSVPTSGDVRFSMDRRPGFFDALKVEGESSSVLGIRDSLAGKIICAGIISRKACYLNGKASTAGYLSSLRMDEKYRNGIILGRLFRFFHEFHINNPSSPKVYLASIFSGNKTAINPLTSGKGGLPEFQFIDEFRTLVFKSRQQKDKGHNHRDINIKKATAEDCSHIINFLNGYGKYRQFFPVYNHENLLNDNGILKGLELKNIRIAFRENEVIGIMGRWNQHPFRQWNISGYSPRAGFFRPLVNLFQAMRCEPGLPRAGQAIPCSFTCLNLVLNNDPVVYLALLSDLVRNCRRENNLYLCTGFFSRDPLLRDFPFPHYTLKSNIYSVFWSEDKNVVRNLSMLNPYLELGSL